MNWYLSALVNYANFSGRTSRTEYWSFAFFNTIIYIALYMIDDLYTEYYILGNIYNIATIIPGIAIYVRRLNDINKSAWHLLLILIPVVGILILFSYACLKSKPKIINEANLVASG